jgi:hypothetical protein
MRQRKVWRCEQRRTHADGPPDADVLYCGGTWPRDATAANCCGWLATLSRRIEATFASLWRNDFGANLSAGDAFFGGEWKVRKKQLLRCGHDPQNRVIASFFYALAQTEV